MEIDTILNQKLEYQATKIETELLREIQSVKEALVVLSTKFNNLETELNKAQQGINLQGKTDG